MNSPLPFQSAGAAFAQWIGPPDKNPLTAGVVGGTPLFLQGTDPIGYAHDTMTSWLTGVDVGDTPSGTSAVDRPDQGTEGQAGTDTSASHTLTRVGVGVLAIVLIGLGIWWAMQAGGRG